MHCTEAILLGYAAAQGRIKTAFGDTGSGGVTGGSVAQKPSSGGGFLNGLATMSSSAATPGIKPITSPKPAAPAPQPQQPAQQPQQSQQQPSQWFDNASSAYQHPGIKERSWGDSIGNFFTGNADAADASAHQAMQSQDLFNNYMANRQGGMNSMSSHPLGVLGIASMLPGGAESVQKIIGDPSQLGQQAAQQSAAPASGESQGWGSRLWNGAVNMYDGAANIVGHAGGLAKGVIGAGAGLAGKMVAAPLQAAGKGYTALTGDDTGVISNLGTDLSNVAGDIGKAGVRDIFSNSTGLAGDVVDLVPGADNAAKAIHGVANNIGTNSLGQVQQEQNRLVARDLGQTAGMLNRGLHAVSNAAAESIPAAMAGGSTAGAGLVAKGTQMGGMAGKTVATAGRAANTVGKLMTPTGNTAGQVAKSVAGHTAAGEAITQGVQHLTGG